MILVIGEALVDVVIPSAASHAAEAITRPGGSPANVAIGLGRLGHAVSLVTALGDDEHGSLVRDHLAASEVAVIAQPIARTASATATLDEHGSATYVFDIDWELGDVAAEDLVGLGGLAVPWVHVGSIAMTLDPGASVARSIAAALRPSAVVSYDPNCRPMIMSERDAALAVIEEQVAQSDLVKLSDEDAEWLFPGQSLDEVARRWLALGPQVVMATRGGDGASAWIADGAGEAGAADAIERLDVAADAGTGPIVDTVGAGDSFMGAVISHLSEQAPSARFSPAAVRDALALAARIARRTCERVGADPPWAGELQR